MGRAPLLLAHSRSPSRRIRLPRGSVCWGRWGGVSEMLNGPELVRWLEARSYSLGEQTLGFHARAIRHWRGGAEVSIFSADPVLTKLDLRADELPADLWLNEVDAEAPAELRVPHRLTDDHLRALHGFHQEGIPVKELARRIWDRAGYASEESAANGLRRGFARLGLPSSTRSPAVRCEGIKSTYPNKGRRCSDVPMVGSDFCWAHHPERRAEVVKSAAAMRERLAAA